MSISDPNIIDAVVANGDELVLLVSDHLIWVVEQVQHLKILQKKLNTYIRFIENKEWKKIYPDKDFNFFKIEVIFKYQWDESFEKMVALVKNHLDMRNIRIEYRKAEDETEE